MSAGVGSDLIACPRGVSASMGGRSSERGCLPEAKARWGLVSRPAIFWSPWRS